MFAAFGIFTAGAIVSIWHGLQQLFAPEDATNFGIAYLVLAVAFVMEGTSFLQAFRQARAGGRRRGVSTRVSALTSSNATLRAVFEEYAAALIGLAIAFLGILLHQITGLAAFDAVGSILVGALLGVVAIVLIDRNRRFLIGQIPDAWLRNDVLVGLLARQEIERVTYLHLESVGPGAVFLVASVDIVGEETETHVAYSLRRIEDAPRQNEHIEDAPRQNEHIEEALLSLSTPDEPSLLPALK